jgi:hypothetical protein
LQPIATAPRGPSGDGRKSSSSRGGKPKKNDGDRVAVAIVPQFFCSLTGTVIRTRGRRWFLLSFQNRGWRGFILINFEPGGPLDVSPSGGLFILRLMGEHYGQFIFERTGRALPKPC